MELPIMHYFPLSCYLVPLRAEGRPLHPADIFEHTKPSSSLNVGDPVSHPYISRGKDYSYKYFNVYISG
jgi:hypothetical protein